MRFHACFTLSWATSARQRATETPGQQCAIVAPQTHDTLANRVFYAPAGAQADTFLSELEARRIVIVAAIIIFIITTIIVVVVTERRTTRKTTRNTGTTHGKRSARRAA